MANRQDGQGRAGPEIGVERSGKERQPHDSGAGEQAGEKPSPWEWVTAAVSALIVLGVIGFMVYEALTEPDAPPRIEIVVDSVVDQGSGYLVEFRVRNTGQATAAGLVVEGELRSDTGTVETAQATIDFVPAESHRSGGLFFSHDPREYSLEIRPKGYDRP